MCRSRAKAFTPEPISVVVVFISILLAACTANPALPEAQSPTVAPAPTATPEPVPTSTTIPSAWTSGIEMNYLEGCEAGLADTELQEDSSRICQCSFDRLSDPVSGVDFAAFVELNNQLVTDPTALESSPMGAELVASVTDCM